MNSEPPNESYFDIIPDDKGFFWMSSGTGLARVKQEDMRAFINGKLDAVQAIVFDESDGMRNKECTGATSSLKASDGSIWVPTLDGVAIIPPVKAKRNTIAPKVAITEFSVDGKPRVDDYTIAAGAFRLKFNYSSLSFLAPEKIHYKYRLSGIDQDWILTTNNEIEYTNLGPGSYTFEVLATNNDGVWSKNTASLDFTIEPYFYQTAYFYFGMILFAIVLTWAIIKIRTYRISKSNRELIKVNKELDRFVYSASHDLRAPLASVLGLVHIGKYEKSLEKKDDCLDLIDKSITKLDSYIGEIIDYSKNQRTEIVKENILISEFIQSVIDDLKFVDNREKVTISIDTNIDECLIDRGRLKVILSNLIGNSLKYVDKDSGQIIIKALDKNNVFQFEVSDNGIGIDKEHQDKIFDMFYRADTKNPGSGLGLYIVKETIERLQGNIEVDSKLGQGTTFRFTIPK